MMPGTFFSLPSKRVCSARKSAIARKLDWSAARSTWANVQRVVMIGRAARGSLTLIEVSEAGLRLQKREADVTGRSIALLGDVHLGDVLIFGLHVGVLIGAEQQHDDVRVLLKGTRIVADDAICEPGCRARHCQIEDLCLG